MSRYRIILVGEDNLTRSIIAEAILKKILKEKDVEDVDISSRGVVVLFSEPISPKAEATLHDHDCDSVTKRSAELTQEDVDQVDLILTMGKNDVDHIREKFEVNTTCMFVGTFIDMEEEIPKIPSDSREAYEECYRITKQVMEAVAERLILELLIP